MHDFDLISVIIPVYNAEKYLHQCLESVLSQTYKNIEIILIDDGSKDSSGAICDDYASKYPFIRAIHKRNGGASSARNVGIDNATGKYIFFLDSDDWIEHDALEKLIVAANQENADLVFCEATTIDEDSGITLKGNYNYKSKYSTDVPYNIMQKMMKNKEFHVVIWLLLLEKSIFDNNNLRFKEGIIYEDMIISYQFFCLARRAAHVDQNLYFRRYRANSVMTSKKTEKNFVSAATVYDEVSSFFEGLPKENKPTDHIVRCSFNVLSIYREMPKQIRKKYKSEFKRIKNDILNKDSYSNTALMLDCHSHFLWAIYKVFCKVFHRK